MDTPNRPHLPTRTIVQISDVHILAEGLQHGCVDNLANLDLVLRRVEDSGLRPELLLLTGDLADRGEPAAYQMLRARVERAAQALDTPVCYLPGNHDDRATMRSELLGEDPSEDPIDQIVWCGGLRVLALDSTIPGEDGGELRDEQLAWMRAELARPAPEGTVVALHHPPVPSPIASMSRIALRRPERLLDAIDGSDVRTILAGHNHHAMSGMLGSIPVWLCAATSYQADPLVPDGRYRGFRGAAFSRIDIWAGTVLATTVMVGDGADPIVDVPMSAMPSS